MGGGGPDPSQPPLLLRTADKSCQPVEGGATMGAGLQCGRGLHVIFVGGGQV